MAAYPCAPSELYHHDSMTSSHGRPAISPTFLDVDVETPQQDGPDVHDGSEVPQTPHTPHTPSAFSDHTEDTPFCKALRLRSVNTLAYEAAPVISNPVQLLAIPDVIQLDSSKDQFCFMPAHPRHIGAIIQSEKQSSAGESTGGETDQDRGHKSSRSLPTFR